jgi:prolyl-tRNA synthetase
VDDDNHSPGWKFAEYELKGVPVRLAIGPKDLEKGTVEVYRRDTRQKQFIPIEGMTSNIKNLLDEIQKNLYEKALGFRNDNTLKVDDYSVFKEILDKKGGFILAHWDGTSETEEKIKEETKATIRCIPMQGEQEDGKCIYSGNPSKQRVIFAKAY